MKKYTADELEGKFIIAFDTICDGWECVKDENQDPFLYHSLEEATEDFDPEEDFILPAAEYIHNRKLIYGSNGPQIIGESLV